MLKNPQHSIVLAALMGCVVALPSQAQSTIWSTTGTTERVNQAEMERARVVVNSAPLNANITGSWSIWVPGGVWYSSDGVSIYRNYTPGAAMNRVSISADGRYQWGSVRGTLTEVRPWHAQEGRRYYRIVHPGGMEYELYYKDSDDTLVFLFGGVGGHAATGSREGGRVASAPASTPAPESSQDVLRPAASSPRPTSPTAADASTFRVGEGVKVSWSGSWYDAKILKVEGTRYFVRYEGWGSSWDEWVAVDRIRRK